jgi:hypothetical protein
MHADLALEKRKRGDSVRDKRIGMCRLKVYMVHRCCYMAEKMHNVQVEIAKDVHTNLGMA